MRDHPSARELNSVDIKENIDGVIDGIKKWLSLPNNTRWLMIYDNYDNPELPRNTDPAAVDIRKFLPESYQGSLLSQQGGHKRLVILYESKAGGCA